MGSKWNITWFLMNSLHSLKIVRVGFCCLKLKESKLIATWSLVSHFPSLVLKLPNATSPTSLILHCLKKFFLFYCFKNFLFIFWLHWVFVASRAFANCSKWGLLSSCGAQASHCSTGSRHMSFSSFISWIPDCSNRGTQAELCLSMQSSAPGIEPVSPALAGGFLSTVPPGKSWF